MWLYIHGQTDPPKVTKAVGNKTEAFGGYWYNLVTGALIFLTRDDVYFETMKTDSIRVWTMSASETKHAVDITYGLTEKNWKYTDRNIGDTAFTAVYDALRKRLDQILDVKVPRPN